MFFLLQFFCMFSFVNGNPTFLPPLSPKEEEHYIELLSKGDENAKNILIERNLRLVAHIVKKYSNFRKDTEDLISIGTIGLIKAVTTYKHGKGSKLVTYAARCIDNEILMFLRSSKKYRNDVSLQDTVGIDKEGNEVTLEEKIADTSQNVEEQTAVKLRILEMYRNMKQVLTGREKTIIELRYGITTGEEVTQREIASMLGISRSYVSRIETKALKKIRASME